MPVINSGCSASVCIPWLSICPWGTVSFIIVGCPVKCLDHGIYSVNAECVNGWYTLNSLTFIWDLFSTGVLITFSYHRILFLKIFIYLAVLSLSCSIYRIFSCGMWDLVPWPGIEPGPPALGAWRLSHRTTRKVPPFGFVSFYNTYHLSPPTSCFCFVLFCFGLFLMPPNNLFPLIRLLPHLICQSNVNLGLNLLEAQCRGRTQASSRARTSGSNSKSVT